MGLEVALLAVAAVGTGASIYQGQKAAKQQKKAVAIQRQQADLQNARTQRDAIRASRLAYAQSQAAAENQGVAGSSSAQGGQGSIVSQLNDNLSFLDQYGLMTDQAQRHLGKAASLQSSASMWGDVAGLAFKVAGNANTVSSAASKVFKPK